VPRLILASASPARLGLLRAAGFDPEVVVSGVAEDDVTGPVADVARELAERKARHVAARIELGDHVVVGCDTVVVQAGVQRGKPATADEARGWWQAAAGQPAEVVTGHAVVDGRDHRLASEVSRTVVHLGTPSPDEIEAYLATGEPLAVAGGLTIDGYGAPFVERIEGDHGTVVGLSLPVLRRLVTGFGVDITSLWQVPVR
jgi:septum formation protein